MRFFNTAGPVQINRHYCLPPLSRLNLEEILLLLQQGKYFVLHAPRQVGKTSFLLALREYLNEQGEYTCLYINVEAAQAARENVQEGMRAILRELASNARDALNDPFPESIWLDVLENSGGFAALGEMLTRWASHSPKPLVLLIDEIDSLVGDMLIAVLRQLRAGYPKRPAFFPQSVILCGVRDVRDYRIHSSQDKAIITGGSAFNIKATSLRMGDFSETEVQTLYAQHTQETGQVFEPEVVELVWHLTQGQPWLVNALGYEVCFNMKENRDRTRPITGQMILEAKENLILRRETHLDQLADKLQEPRVRRILEPVLTGSEKPDMYKEDDLQYVEDLGLIKARPQVRVANPIYQEIIPRVLSYSTQVSISHPTTWYVTPTGRLDLDKLLMAFQQFFREHSESWVERFDYKEAGPHLLMQAFLQRIINSHGWIGREYGLGRKRTDLLIQWKYGDTTQRAVIELKILRGQLSATIQEGLAQTAAYMDRANTPEGHLVIFDRSPTSWDEKIFTRTETHQGREIKIWGM